MRVLVIVPAKDEAQNLEPLLSRLRAVHPLDSVLVVDDGSSDATPEIARGAGCRVVSHAFNLGYGAALLTGYHYALAEGFTHIVQLDGDGQHPPEAISSLLEPLVEGRADLVVGSRYLADGARKSTGWLRRAASAPMAWIASRWTGTQITDPTSGFQALSTPAIIRLCSDGFPEDFPDIDVLIDAHRAGLKLQEVPVQMHAREHGRSMHGGLRAIYYFYRLGVCLLLLPVRRSSPYRRER